MSSVIESTQIYTLTLKKAGKINYPVERAGDSNIAGQAMRAFLKDRDCEHMAIMLLDAHHTIIGMALVASGQISGLKLAVRDIFKYVLVGRANAFVIGHNHPSGDVSPSKEDIAFTAQVSKAAVALGVPMLDHIIVSSGINEDFYSFYDNGIM